jgi:D-beta-D-heptose 7-phosphate kinase/D-beta-D-heptose 1-phosphate adenosyltransferase
MAGRRVLVVGDVMLDEFVWGHVARISPEAPVPVVTVTGQSHHLGGAANVAGNVRALGGEAVVAGVVGEDEAGARLRGALAAADVEDALVSVAARPTTVKTRVIAHHQQVVRTDREVADAVAGEALRALAEAARRHLRHCDAVVVSDYRKGVVTAPLLKALLPAARRRRVPVLVDPKVRHLDLYRGATLVTPNLAEAEEGSGVAVRDAASLEKAGRTLLRRLLCAAVLVTRGEHGMSLFPREGRTVHIPTAAREVFDVTGAGDTVIATLALALAAGASPTEAARVANLAAGVVVGKVGTATATAAEILAGLASPRPA